MNKIAAVLKYFPSGTAEGDKQFLEKAFINPDQLATVLSSQPGNPCIMVGRKGVGKTAVLEWLAQNHRQNNIPSILIRPDDLETSKFGTANDIAALKKAMFESLLQSVAVCIGTQLKGLLSKDAATLYEHAVRKGSSEPDFVGKVLELVDAISLPIYKVSISSLTKCFGRGHNDIAIEKAVRQYLKSQKQVFVLLVDDTDQIASPGQPDHYNRIWALMLAVRKLAESNPFIRCVMTLRTEVWLRLTRNDRGQRDQIDHFRPLLVWLRTDESHMQRILDKRFELAADDAGLENKGKSNFFQSDSVSLPGSQESRTWNSFILKSSRERPRDMIQLVAHLAKQALSRESELIDDIDAAKAMKDYSKERAEDLAIEMGDSCPMLLDVVRAFATADFEMEFEQLRIFLTRLPSRFSIVVNGKSMQPENDGSFISLLSLLHEADFINPRVEDVNESRRFRHISFIDNPHLVTISRWNELQGMRWEVHPAFRSYLLSLRPNTRLG